MEKWEETEEMKHLSLILLQQRQIIRDYEKSYFVDIIIMGMT
jgi:hypothetical protein